MSGEAIRPEFQPREGERSHGGIAIRSNVAWRELAESAYQERDAIQAELSEARVALSDHKTRADELGKRVAALRRELDRDGVAAVLRRELEAARAKANNAQTRADSALLDALCFAAESDERGKALGDLAQSVSLIPLGALEAADAWPEVAERYLKAKVLLRETPSERRARIAKRLESGS